MTMDNQTSQGFLKTIATKPTCHTDKHLNYLSR